MDAARRAAEAQLATLRGTPERSPLHELPVVLDDRHYRIALHAAERIAEFHACSTSQAVAIALDEYAKMIE